MFKPHTLSILKNFAQINQGIIIREGSVLRTMSIRKNIAAETPVEDTFNREIPLYDLNEFMATMNLFGKPEIDFSDEYILISDSENTKNKIKYFYSSPNVIISPPEKPVSMPEPDAKFSITASNFEQIIKASSVMRLKSFGVNKNGISVYNENSVGNIYSIECPVEFTCADDFKFQIAVENLKIIAGDYNVSISSKGLAKFECKSPAFPDLVYYIALDVDSN